MDNLKITEETRTYTISGMQETDEISDALHDLADVISASGMFPRSLAVTRKQGNKGYTITSTLERKFEQD